MLTDETKARKAKEREMKMNMIDADLEAGMEKQEALKKHGMAASVYFACKRYGPENPYGTWAKNAKSARKKTKVELRSYVHPEPEKQKVDLSTLKSLLQLAVKELERLEA